MNKTILVTGGAGHVGSHVIEELVADKQNHVISLDNYFNGSEKNHIPGAEYRRGHTKDIHTLIPETPYILYHLGEYPGLVLDPAATEVQGTIFAVPDEAVLAALDAYEGFEPDDPARSLFVRTRVAATLPDGRALDCSVYVYNRDPAGAPLIRDGRWTPASGTGRSSSRSPSRPDAPSR